MRSSPEAQKERSLDAGQGEEASGIEALPRRLERYGDAKRRALDQAEYIEGFPEIGNPGVVRNKLLASRISSCGNLLAFRHYYTVDQVRLHAASFCMKHLLCPLCAIRRGSKLLQAYLARYEVIKAARPRLVPFLVTLTVKDGADLAERFKHLHKAQRELWKRKQRGRGSVFDLVQGAVWAYEVKRGKGSGLWHPHLHMVALAETRPDQAELSREWRQITGDSFVVDVRPIGQDDLAGGFCEVFKYALKFSDMSTAETFEAFRVLGGRRLVASAGAFFGVDVPDELTDEPLDGLPFVELLYRHFTGRGYSLIGRQAGGVGSAEGSRVRLSPA